MSKIKNANWDALEDGAFRLTVIARLDVDQERLLDSIGEVFEKLECEAEMVVSEAPARLRIQIDDEESAARYVWEIRGAVDPESVDAEVDAVEGVLGHYATRGAWQ